MNDQEKIHELTSALHTMLVAIDSDEPETFAGHHEAFLRVVAIPRALGAYYMATGEAPSGVATKLTVPKA